MQLMLGKNVDLRKIAYPCIASIKYDGMQAITLPMQEAALNKKRTVATNLFSRNFKPVPNEHVRNTLANLSPGLQGELVAKGASFASSMSGLRSIDGEPEFEFIVFNCWGSYDPIFLSLPYEHRMKSAAVAIRDFPNVRLVEQVVCNHTADVERLASEVVAQGHEGLMLTYTDAPYVPGRSNYLIKVKNFAEGEFELVDMHPEICGDTAIHRAAGTVGSAKDKLGALICRMADGTYFRASCGFDDNYGETLWRNRDKYIGKLVTVKYLTCGQVRRPRHPVAKSIRDYE